MLKSYLKIAFRNLSRQKILAGINVSGLSIGIACFSLFLLYAVNEFSYDRWHKNADRIFRVNQVWTNDNGERQGMAGLYMPLGPALKKDFPDVENFVRIHPGGEEVVRVNNKMLRVSVGFADPSIFSVFSFPLLQGVDSLALKDPHAIVVTRTAALQLFGDLNCVGKTLEIKMRGESPEKDYFQPFAVSAVADDIPANSSIRFSILGSFGYLASAGSRKEGQSSWSMTFGDETYVQLRKGSSLDKDPAKLLNFRFRYYPGEEAAYRKEKKITASFELRPLRATHVSPEIESGPPDSATDPKKIWILIAIASGILVIACINFTTLAIGRSAGRAKEVGIRKVMGGKRQDLTYQFLMESLVLSVFSAVIGILLANLLLPYFSQFCGRSLNFSFSQFPELGWLLGGLTLIVALLAGSYPALILSGFRPVDVLKSKIKLGGSNIFTRSLVTFQFTLSAILIISTLIIFRQLHYMRSKNIGFTKENVVVIHAGGAESGRIWPLYRQALQSHREITGVAGAQIGLGEGEGEMGGNAYNFKGKELFSIIYPVDADYLKVMDMRLVAGRNFSPVIAADSAGAIIINETFAKNNLGMNATQAVGTLLKQARDSSGRPVMVIGVVRDYNYEPLTGLVRPQVFTMPRGFQPDNFFVRIQPGDPVAAVNLLKKTWSGLVPELAFNYSFLDEDLDRFYKSEEKWSRIVGWAAGLSIFLACLGLFGLAALAVVNRTREIGIRKVLGASARSIVRLVSADFLKLVMIALLIAAPVAWYVMQKWLQDYAYRIDIGWWVFAVTAMMALLVAFITVGLQAVRAAFANPVDSLRTE